MDTQESSTFLEDFVNSTELLPNDVRRNFELMRELDRDGSEALRQCEEAEVLIVRFSYSAFMQSFRNNIYETSI